MWSEVSTEDSNSLYGGQQQSLRSTATASSEVSNSLYGGQKQPLGRTATASLNEGSILLVLFVSASSPLLGPLPLHPPVLKPDLHLKAEDTRRVQVKTFSRKISKFWLSRKIINFQLHSPKTQKINIFGFSPENTKTIICDLLSSLLM